MKNKMTKIALGLALFIGSLSGAYADSLHPCTPTVRAQDSRMGCQDESKGLSYSIVLKTMMSDIRICPLKDSIEVTTAHVSIRNIDAGLDEQDIATLTIAPGYFEAKYGIGDAQFKSKALRLNLKGCSMPMNGGGLSGGNLY